MSEELFGRSTTCEANLSLTPRKTAKTVTAGADYSCLAKAEMDEFLLNVGSRARRVGSRSFKSDHGNISRNDRFYSLEVIT